ncbi:hypothetical protein SNE40_021812 [Patella caerulea]|uniref:Gag3-Pol3 n=1 Tax=Patella caerulea TaxID=87958 RepID=A0AAN8J0R1_PATCE
MYVSLDNDAEISSVLRIANDVILKPQTRYIVHAKLKRHSYDSRQDVFMVEQATKGFVSSEPGLMVSNSLFSMERAKTFGKRIPVFLVNGTNKTFRLKSGCVIGRAVDAFDSTIASVDQVLQGASQCTNANLNEKFAKINVPDTERAKLFNLLRKNHDLFAISDSELGHTDTVKMTIDTGNHSPIKQRAYRTPLTSRPVVNEAIDDMLRNNIIKESNSPWSFPIVLVDKKDGTKRFCVDFRKLNKITKTVSWPLPLIEDMLGRLDKSEYFTTLDMKSGYWQVLVDEKDKEKTAFVCHRGLFEFNVMPFGINNCPSIFSHLMARVLKGLEDFAIAYIDDILIYSRSKREHYEHIKLVFDRLRQHGLKLKPSKCNFFQQETKYLGFVITPQGIKTDQDKVCAIKGMDQPRTVKEVRSFMGMCSYYRRFIPNFSTIAEPLIKLTKKYAKFKWTSECQTAFEFLKESLTTVPLLAYPDPNLPYILYTDASDTSIGAALVQVHEDGNGGKVERPIYFLSHKLSKSQVKWSVVEREAYAIHYALQKLDYYLHNAKFTIRTDHKPLQYLLESPMQNKKIQLWALGIAGFNCTIEYVPGKQNSIADLLSRVPSKQEANDNNSDGETIEPRTSDNMFEISAFNSNEFVPHNYAKCTVPDKDLPDKIDLNVDNFDIEKEQNDDPEIVSIIKQLKANTGGSKTKNRFLLIDKVLYFISSPDDDPTLRLYIPQHLQNTVIKQYHDNNGHLGIDKTHDTIKRHYYFPNMYVRIHNHVNECVLCQSRSLTKQIPPMQFYDIPPYAFAKIGLDLSGPYPTTLSGNKYIISFICHFSGYAEAFAVKSKSAENVAHLLIEEIFPRYGAPLELVTDNGSENVNRIMEKTLKELNIKHVLTSFYHPQANARVERMHRTMHDILSKKIAESYNTWDLYLNQTLAAIRFNVNESTKFSPFYLLYNRDPVLPLDNILKPRRKYLGTDPHEIALQNQHKAFLLVHKRLRKTQRKNAEYVNKNATDTLFKVGDPVYYKNHLQKHKLQERWTPYYRIIEQTSPVSFIIHNQLTGRTTKSNAQDLRLAKLDNWQIPEKQSEKEKLLRKAHYVEDPSSSDSSSENETSEPDDDVPLAQLATRFRRERSESASDGEDVPLMELSKRLKARDDQDTENVMDTNSLSSSGSDTSDDERNIDADVLECDIKSDGKLKPEKSSNKKTKQLLKLIASML